MNGKEQKPRRRKPDEGDISRWKDEVERVLKESIQVKERSLMILGGDVARAAREMVVTLSGGGKIMVCGNGGSAADAQHMACEMVVKFSRERRALPAFALTTDSSVLTAQANDHDFISVFARQIEALGSSSDLLLVISTSGRSPNVLEAAKTAKRMGMKVIGLMGAGGGSLSGLCDVSIKVPSKSTPRIQEAHVTIIHALCGIIEEELCS